MIFIFPLTNPYAKERGGSVEKRIYMYLAFVQLQKKHDLSNNEIIIEPRHEISNNVVRATSTGSDQPAHMRSLITDFASRLTIL